MTWKGCRLAALAAVLAVPATARAQTGLLVVAHGANAEWNDGVRATVAQVSWSRGPVATAFLMGPEADAHGWDSAVTRLVRSGASDIVVVPLMVSSHGSHYRQVLHYAGALDELPEELGSHAHHAMAPPVPMRVTAALDHSPELGMALGARWAELDSTDRRRAVLLVAHGPNGDADAALWMSALASVGAELDRAGLRQDFRIGLLRDDAPAPVRAGAVAAMRDTLLALAQRTSDSVVVLPVMIATSSITRVRIPTDLAGLPMRYARVALTPHPAIARWIERLASAMEWTAAAPREP
jgi:sirohydrochlorin cobaltochelatase